jgi:hypothetical protein
MICPCWGRQELVWIRHLQHNNRPCPNNPIKLNNLAGHYCHVAARLPCHYRLSLDYSSAEKNRNEGVRNPRSRTARLYFVVAGNIAVAIVNKLMEVTS